MKLKAYKPGFINELSDNDWDRRVKICRELLNEFLGYANRQTLILTDEYAIYLSYKSRNTYFWAKSNPYFREEISEFPPHCMVWAGISGLHLMGPYFSMELLMEFDIKKCWRCI